jgi:hypothetical protein
MSSFQINNYSLATYGAIGLTSVVLALITVYDNYVPEGTEVSPPGTDSAAIFNSLMPASFSSSVGSMLGTTPSAPEKEESGSASLLGPTSLLGQDESASSSLFGQDESANKSLLEQDESTSSLFGNDQPAASAPSLFETEESTEPSLFETEESTRGGKKRKTKSNKSTKKKR